jgi:hypothetical protein
VLVMFEGDRDGIMEDTRREMAALPMSGEEFRFMAGIADPNLLLDPKEAVPMPERELLLQAGATLPADFKPRTIYVPRVPIDAAEAAAMLGMVTLIGDATLPPGTDPASLIRTYAGYTDDELLRGRPAVRVR